MADRIHPPWSDEQVEALNNYQTDAPMHPFTCANRDGKNHKDHDERDHGILVATREGWVCRDCPYHQDWAYPWMADNSWWMD